MTKKPSCIKILIVDDFALDTQCIIRQLKSNGAQVLTPTKYDIKSALTGHDGLILAQEFQPDCILLDYGLPDMNGLEFIDSLVEIRGGLKVPIVMLTGQGDERIAVNAMKRGVHDYLIKGNFNAGQLTWTIFGALEKAKLQKQVHSKHEELEMFASRMAHDILGPLSSLSLYAEYLEIYDDKFDDKSSDTLSGEGIVQDYAVQDYAVQDHVAQSNAAQNNQHANPLNAIMSSVDHIIDMVESFREYARIGRTSRNFTQVNLGAIMDHILLLLQSEINEVGAEIHIDPLPVVIGDSAGLGQLLQNLISNAIKYCSDKPYIEVNARQHGSKWQISVSDNGIGIDNAAQIHDEIFEPFVRTHSRAQYPGSGIGLATCRKIAEQHDGEIWFSSTPKSGTTFYFTLEQDLEVMLVDELDDHLIENLALLDHRHIFPESSAESLNPGRWALSAEQRAARPILPNKHTEASDTYYH